MGTWALPQTKAQAEALKTLMMQPLKAKEAGEKLYSIFGDDDLFDAIADIRQTFGDDSDVRSLTAEHLAWFLRNPESATAPWDSEAYAICQKICTLVA